MSRLITLIAASAANLLLPIGLAALAELPPPDALTDTPRDEDVTSLSKKRQDPIGDLYTLPFQNNINFNTGRHKGTQDILNLQPVLPIHINEDWNIITRTMLPLVWQTSLQPVQTVPFGTGPTTFSAYLAPRYSASGWLLGVGPVIQIPSITDKSLGSNVWGVGPSGVVVYKKGPWVAGALVFNVWSFGGTTGPGGTRYNAFMAQPFVNYNFSEGWFVGTAPIITANWRMSVNNAWVVPVGALAGRVVKIAGDHPVNLSVGAYYNALRPQFGSTWQLRTLVTLIY